MKPFAIISRAMAAALLLIGGGGAAQEATNAREASAGATPPKRIAGFDSAEAALPRRLATPEAARAFRQYDAAGGQSIQQHLAVIYAAVPEFRSDAGATGRPLGDGIVGPVTLKWLARFCRDYGIVATGPAFDRVVVTSLERVASFARVHPDWLEILGSEDFDDWINGQPAPQRVESLKMRRAGDASQVNALIELYLKSRTAP